MDFQHPWVCLKLHFYAHKSVKKCIFMRIKVWTASLWVENPVSSRVQKQAAMCARGRVSLPWMCAAGDAYCATESA